VAIAVGMFPADLAVRAQHRCSRVNPRFDEAPRLPGKAASARASDGRWKRGGRSASLPQEDTKTRLFPAWKASLCPVRLLRGGVPPPPLESSVPLTGREMAVFSPVRGTAAHAQLGPHPIEMSNADQEAELFLQGGLDHMTWGMRGFTTRGLKKLPHWWTEFGRMSMPSIEASRLPLADAHCAAIGKPLIDRCASLLSPPLCARGDPLA
jgi:hypothetical protein